MEYRSRMIVCQKDVRESQISTDRQTMALHLAEEEIVRLQSLLSTAATVAPIVCKAVLKAAPGFDFKDRGFEVGVLPCHHFLAAIRGNTTVTFINWFIRLLVFWIATNNALCSPRETLSVPRGKSVHAS